MNLDFFSAREMPLARWGMREIIYAGLLALGGIVLLNLGALGLGFLTGAPLRLTGGMLNVFLLAQSAIFMGAVWLFGMRRYRVGWDALGWRRFDMPLGCALSAGALVASYAVNVCYAVFVISLGVKLSPQEVMLRLDVTGWGAVVAFLIVAGLVPVVEETFFRGFVYGGLRGRMSTRWAMFLGALVFALLHFSLDRLIPILVLGWALAWLYERTGSLVPGVILHAANNAFALAVYWMAKSFGVPLP